GKLQGQENLAVMLANLVDLDDIGMPQPGHGLRLGTQPTDFLPAGHDTGPDHLQGDKALSSLLPGFVDNAHAAAAELAQHLVAWQLRQTATGRNDCWQPLKLR